MAIQDAKIPPEEPKKRRWIRPQVIPNKKCLYTYEQVRQALIEYKGRIFATSKALRISPRTLRFYCHRKWPKLLRVLDMFAGRLVDDAELKMQQLMERGDFNATKFILLTKGKKRGWTFSDRVVKHVREGGVSKQDLPQITEEVKKKLIEDARERERQKKLLGQERLEIGLKELPPASHAETIQDAEVVEKELPPPTP